MHDVLYGTALESLLANPALLSFPNATSIISTPLTSLQSSLNLSYNNAMLLKKLCSQTVLPVLTSNTAFSRFPDNFVSFGTQLLDHILLPSLNPGCLFEISGLAGSGKTQLCYQVLLSSIIKDDSLISIYIKTEGTFSVERMTELIELRGLDPAQYLPRIFVEESSTLEDLESTVVNLLPNFLDSHKAAVVIIDSICAPVRYGNNTIGDASLRLLTLAADLKSISYKYNVPIITVNQVTSTLSSTGQSITIPSLGLSWSYIITARLMIFRDHDVMENGTVVESGKPRKAMFSSSSGGCKFLLSLSSFGLDIIEFLS
ncbi:hypothetical protein RCL1_005502 [Eukaryota sp. TZLM3-RCL]